MSMVICSRKGRAHSRRALVVETVGKLTLRALERKVAFSSDGNPCLPVAGGREAGREAGRLGRLGLVKDVAGERRLVPGVAQVKCAAASKIGERREFETSSFQVHGIASCRYIYMCVPYSLTAHHLFPLPVNPLASARRHNISCVANLSVLIAVPSGSLKALPLFC
jgi:hypothetical protein